MPQGDFQTFSSTVFGVGLLFVGGYFGFVGWWAPRLALIVKTRDWLARTEQPVPTELSSRSGRWDPTVYLGAAGLSASGIQGAIERLRGLIDAYPEQAEALRELIALLEGWLAGGMQPGDLAILIALIQQILAGLLGVSTWNPYDTLFPYLSKVFPWVYLFTALMTVLMTIMAAYVAGISNNQLEELRRYKARDLARQTAPLPPVVTPPVVPPRPRRWGQAATLVGASSLWSESFLVFVQFAGLALLLSGAAALTVELALQRAPAGTARLGSPSLGATHAGGILVNGWPRRRGQAFSGAARGVDHHLGRVAARLAPVRPAPAGVLARLRGAATPAE